MTLCQLNKINEKVNLYIKENLEDDGLSEDEIMREIDKYKVKDLNSYFEYCQEWGIELQYGLKDLFKILELDVKDEYLNYGNYDS